MSAIITKTCFMRTSNTHGFLDIIKSLPFQTYNESFGRNNYKLLFPLKNKQPNRKQNNKTKKENLSDNSKPKGPARLCPPIPGSRQSAGCALRQGLGLPPGPSFLPWLHAPKCDPDLAQPHSSSLCRLQRPVSPPHCPPSGSPVCLLPMPGC